MNTSLNEFTLMLVTNVITNNLQNSDIPGFGEILHNCIELLWRIGNKDNNKLTIKHIFNAILDADGVFGVLISETYGHRCLKRILFDFNIIEQQEEQLKTVNVVTTLVEKCSKHNDVSKAFSIYKACTTLLKVLNDTVKLNDNKESKKKRTDNNIPNNSTFLSTGYEQYLDLLKMKRPQNPSELSHFLHTLEQRKLDSFRVIIFTFYFN
jgi:hypothetical protein